MKNFSLKKKPVPEGRVEKKIGGFSLKSKNASKDIRPQGDKKSLGFGDDEKDHDDKTAKNNSIVELTNVEDLVEKEDPDRPLIIVPSHKTVSMQSRLQSLLAQQAEREKKEIAEKESELAKENELLGFGLNEPSKPVEDTAEKPSTPSTSSTDTLSAKLSEIGGEEPTDESYSKVPVSKFGLAMLRGMGWNEELEKERRRESRKAQATSQPATRRRAPLAGLGASVHGSGASRR